MDGLAIRVWREGKQKKSGKQRGSDFPTLTAVRRKGEGEAGQDHTLGNGSYANGNVTF